MLAFNRIVVLRNPASTRAVSAQKQIKTLRSLAGDAVFEVIETSAGGREANKVLLRTLGDKLGPHTLLCVAAGDGTINVVIEILLTDPALPDEARRTPVLPLWGGNANDLAHMLNGPAWRTSVKRILGQGSVTQVRPLECHLTYKDGTQKVHLAVCYASFGASAFAAHRLAEPARRHHPLDALPGGRAAKELMTVIRALIDAPQLTVQEGAQTRNMYEHIFLKGSRFAKVQGVSLQLTAPHFYHTVMRIKRARTLFFHIWEMTAPRAVSRVSGDHAEFTPHAELWAQVDGEVFAVPAGTKVTIGLSKRPVYLLNTLLKPTA
jgi:diacylglycerol kinase family enzyme